MILAALGMAIRPTTFEQALEEADWMVQHGQRAEARALLAQQLERNPNHPLLLERMEEVDQVGAELDALLSLRRSLPGQGIRAERCRRA